MTLSQDGSYTAYSKEYDEHYHSTRDGALNESLYKHVYPAFKIKQNLETINILDICFGLGFNTLATIYYHKLNNFTCKLNIYSPELDESLVKSLNDFRYPKEFDDFKEIISELIRSGIYSDENLHVEVFLGDAREYVKGFENKFDVVYQDAFSPSTNPILWTKEYFSDIKTASKKDAVLTTYSTALPTRIALWENGFYLYINSGENFRNATVASLVELDEFLHVDIEHKISCNPTIKSLRD
ncbi:MnmC family methyltransferase [Sulfurimonas sp.]|nr:MnmC family methyltransferase [Sulfurimonas sp.]